MNQDERHTRLLTACEDRFSELSIAELGILETAVEKSPIDDGTKLKLRFVRARLIRWLATDAEIKNLIDPTGLFLGNILIVGALELGGCDVLHNIHFDRCHFTDQLDMVACRARGIYFHRCRFISDFSADGIQTTGPLFVIKCVARKTVRLIGARVQGNLTLNRTCLLSSSMAAVLDGANITNSAFFINLRAYGEVRMLNSSVGGDLGFKKARFLGTANSLMLDKTSVLGLLTFGEDFEAKGLVGLSSATIRGDVVGTNIVLGAKGVALNMSTCEIGGHIHFSGVKSGGLLRFHSIIVANSIDLSGSVIDTPVVSIDFERAKLNGSLFLDGIKAEGRISAPGTAIQGDVDLDGADVAGFYLVNSKVSGSLTWTSIKNSKVIYLWLNGTSVDRLDDDEASWPISGRLQIEGFTYKRLTLHEERGEAERANNTHGKPRQLNVLDRIRWINLQPEYLSFEPQPWMQFHAFLKSRGLDSEAKQLIYAMRLRRRSTNPLLRAWIIASAKLERQPLLILATILMTTLFGTLVFTHAAREGAISPTSRDAAVTIVGKNGFEIAYPRFNPFIYSLENDLPLVKMGQDDKWGPSPTHHASSLITTYTFLSCVRWLLILFGWLQATILATAVANRFKSD